MTEDRSRHKDYAFFNIAKNSNSVLPHNYKAKDCLGKQEFAIILIARIFPTFLLHKDILYINLGKKRIATNPLKLLYRSFSTTASSYI